MFATQANNFFFGLFTVKSLIISAKEVMFLPGFVCVFVSLFVNKITQKLVDGF